jgi:hypothetical protein
MRDEVGCLPKVLPQLLVQLLARSLPQSHQIGGSLGVPPIAILGRQSAFGLILGVAVGEAVEGLSFLSIERVALGFVTVFGDEHMLEICDLFSILSKLNVLEVVYLLLG